MEEGQCQTYSLLEVMQLNLYYIGLMCKSRSAPDLRTCVLLFVGEGPTCPVSYIDVGGDQPGLS